MSQPAPDVASELARVDARLLVDLEATRARPDEARRARVLDAIDAAPPPRTRRRSPIAPAALALAVAAGLLALALGTGGAESSGPPAEGQPPDYLPGPGVQPDAAASAPSSRRLEPVRAISRLVPDASQWPDLDEALRDEPRRLAADALRLVEALTASMPGPLRHALGGGAGR